MKKAGLLLAALAVSGVSQPSAARAQNQDVCTLLAQRLQPDVLQQGSSADFERPIRACARARRIAGAL